MNDKEIEAIRLLNLCTNSNAPLPEEALSWVKIVLNLTERLQKENETLKEELNMHSEASDLFIKDNCIYKQDIRNKLKELEGQLMTHKARSVLRELLEEE